MYGLILLGVGILILGICAGMGAIRGLSRSGIRGISVLCSAVAAVIACVVIKMTLPGPDEAVETIYAALNLFGEQLGADVVGMVETVMGYLSISTTLLELAIQVLFALLLPLLCFVLFAVFSFITWIPYLVVAIACRKPLNKLDTDKKITRLAAAGIGLAEGLVVVALLFLPVSGYLTVADATVNGMIRQEIVKEDSADLQAVGVVVEDMNQSPVIQAYRVMGGNLVTNVFMTMTVADMEIKLEDEMNSILTLAHFGLELYGTQPEAYGEEEAQLVRDMGDSFGDSKVVTLIMSDAVYAMTNSLMKGEAFLGITMPELGEDGEMFKPVINLTLEILHEDATSYDQMSADVKTLTEMGAIMIESGVVANMKDNDALLNILGGGDVIKRVITTLEGNETMSRLVPEITNLGMYAIGQMLNIPENAEAIYGEFMDDVTGILNDVKALPEEERVEVLTNQLSAAFDEVGITVNEEMLDSYVTGMVDDLIVNDEDGEITDADVQKFFFEHSEGIMQNVQGNLPQE